LQITALAAAYFCIVAAMRLAISHDHTILFSFAPPFFAGLAAFATLVAIAYTPVPQTRRAAFTCVMAIVFALVLGSIVGYMGLTCTRGFGIGGLTFYIVVVAFSIAGIVIRVGFAAVLLASALLAAAAGKFAPLRTTPRVTRIMAWSAAALFIVMPYAAQIALPVVGVQPASQLCVP
jgi:hypothetical protein